MGVRPLLAQAPVALRPLLAQAPVALRANNVRPYGYACADGLHGAPGSYPRAPSLAAAPQFTLPHPTVRLSITLITNF